MESLTFQPVFSSWCAAVLLWGGTVAASFLFLKRSDRFTSFQKRFLFTLRFFVLLIFGLILVRPGINTEIVKLLPASLGILLDSSESMSISDMNGETRYQNAVSAVNEINSCAKELPLSLFSFDRTSHLLSDEGEVPAFPQNPEGDETAIGTGLDVLLNRYTGKRLIGVFLLSDGAERSDSGTLSPQEAALGYRNAGVPIYVIPLGSADDAVSRRDIALDETAFPDRVFLGNELTAAGQVRLTGYKGKTIPLIFSAEKEGKMVQVDSIELTAESDEQTIPYRFSYRPEIPGEVKLTLSIPLQEGELLKENNEANGYVQVEEGNLPVLFLEGKRRFEDKFIRMALDSTKEIQVDYRRFSSDFSDSNRKEKLPDLNGCSALILGDLDLNQFEEKETAKIAERVSEGMGLIFLAGEENIGNGKLKGTPLEDLVPVVLYEPILQEPGEEGPYIDQKYKIRPAESAFSDYLTLLSVDPVKSAKLWEGLPSLKSLMRSGELKETGRVILEGADENGELFPALVSMIYGQGRVLLFLTDTTWQWGMSRSRDLYQKFWRQSLFWISGADKLKPGDLVLQKDRSLFASGEPVEFRIRYTLVQPEKKNSLKIDASVEIPGTGSVPIQLERNAEGWKTVFDETVVPGEYRVRVAVSEDGNLKEKTIRFFVRANRRELENPAAFPGLMENIAEISRGRVLTSEEIKPLMTELCKEREGIASRTCVHRSLCSSWSLFAVCVLLLAAEWFFRKKWGMV